VENQNAVSLLFRGAILLVLGYRHFCRVLVGTQQGHLWSNSGLIK
jgi:hypothetical protein